MNLRKLLISALVVCLCAAALSPAAAAADAPALGDFIDRYGPLLGDGLDALTDWLDGQTAKLAPELRETLRDMDTDGLLDDLKALVGETRDMDDAQLRETLLALGEKHGVHLVDAQVTQLIALCRTLEKLDTSTLQERLDALRRALDDPPASGLRGAWEAVKKAVTDAADWLARTLGGLFR